MGSGWLPDPREALLRRGVAAIRAKEVRQGEMMLFAVATTEADRLSRELNLNDDDGGAEILASWAREQRGPRNLVAGGKKLRPVESRNVLLARLRMSMRCRAIEVWRRVYAHHNPLAQFFWVRFGKALKGSGRLVERDGLVRLAERPSAGPGRAELVEIHGLRAPSAPVARNQRQRLKRGADTDYERWMVDCLHAARGGLKRRTLAELLARAHGQLPRYPGQAAHDAVETAGMDALSELEADAMFTGDEEDEGA